MSFTVCRYNEADTHDFTEATLAVMRSSEYKQKASLESAPESVDCLTLVHYLFEKTMGVRIPLTHIGNMVGQLNACKEWSVLEIPPEAFQNGDLLFTEKVDQEGVEKFNRTAFITHVGIFLQLSPIAPKRILHTTKLFKRPVFHTVDAFRKFYQQTLSTDQAILYIDHRDPDRQKKGKFDKKHRAVFRQVVLLKKEEYNGIVPSPSPRDLVSTTSRASSREGSRPGSTPPGVRIRTPTPHPLSPSPVPHEFTLRFSIGSKNVPPDHSRMSGAGLRRPSVTFPSNGTGLLTRSLSDQAYVTRSPGDQV